MTRKLPIIWIVLTLVLSPILSFAEQRNVPVQGTEENWKSLEALLRRQDVSGDWRDDHGHSLVYLHLFFGSEKVAAELLRNSRQSGVWKESNVRLMNLAVVERSQAVVGALLKRGESPDAISDREECPLELATLDGRLEIMRMLIRAGANLECSHSKASNPLQTALKKGQWRAASLLIDAGANLKSMRSAPHQSSLLFYSIEGGSHKAIDVLIDHGFSVNIKDANGETPLTFSIKSASSTYLVDTLLQHGADPCQTNKNRQTANEVITELMASGKIWASQYANLFKENCDAVVPQ